MQDVTEADSLDEMDDQGLEMVTEEGEQVQVQPTDEEADRSTLRDPEQTAVDTQVDDWISLLDEEQKEQPKAAGPKISEAELAQLRTDASIRPAIEQIMRSTNNPQDATRMVYSLIHGQPMPEPAPAAAPTSEFGEGPDPTLQEIQNLRRELGEVKQGLGQVSQNNAVNELERVVDAHLQNKKLSGLRKHPELFDGMRTTVLQNLIARGNTISPANVSALAREAINGEVDRYRQITRALMPAELRALAQKKKNMKTGSPPASGPKTEVRSQPAAKKKTNVWTEDGKKAALQDARAFLQANIS